MSISEIKNIFNTHFTRDTKIDYQTEDYALSIWFSQWDTDRSGDFNDAEWAKYQDDLLKAERRKSESEKAVVNEEVVTTYTNIIGNINKKYQNLEQKFNNIDSTNWDKLLEFEQKHPEIQRYGLTDGEELPQGAYEFDISAIEVGIYDEENDCYTGECYKKGYITGLENLTEEEKTEYLTLLKSSLENAKLVKEYIKEANELEKEYDKYSALQDMAETGVITEIPNSEDENKLYSQYVSIRNNSNPFYKEIKNIEQKLTALRLKGTKTDADLKQIEQYQIQLNQLYNASSQWRLSNCSERPNLNAEEDSANGSTPPFQITNLSGNISYNEGTISESNSIGAEWNPNESVHASANVEHSIEFSDENKDFSNNVNAYAEIGYSSGNFNAAVSEEVNYTPEMQTYTHGVNASYKNVSANITKETINSTEEESVNTTSVALSWNTEKYTTTGSAELTKSGNTYSLSSAANYDIAIGSSNSTLKLNPELRGSYNNATGDWMLAPTINLYGEIKVNRAIVIFNASESHVTTFSPNSEITTNHNFTASGNIEVNNWSFGTQFNDSDTPESHSDTYGLNISYRINDIGTISAEASHQISRTKGTPDRSIATTFNIAFKTSFEALGKLFGKK